MLTEIATFFKQNDATRAFSALAQLLCTLRMSDKTLFGTTAKPNAKHSPLCEILQTLLLFPCCAIGNPYRYDSSPLFARVSYHKDTSYVEQTFGNLKWNKKFKRFLLRGIEKVEIKFGLLALAHNLSKFVAQMA